MLISEYESRIVFMNFIFRPYGTWSKLETFFYRYLMPKGIKLKK